MESVLKHLFTNRVCVWYFLLLICLHTSSTEASITNRRADVLTEHSQFASENSAENINSMKNKYFWWFRPRLGRRKSTHDDDNWMGYGNTEKDFVREFKRESQELVPLKVRTHNTISFTPRLGRANEEEVEHLYYPQAATRFGRRQKYLPFSPRLGRKLPFDQNCLFINNLPTCRQ